MIALVAGVDLNHRPLGYEGKTAEDAIQTQQIKSKKILERASLQLVSFAPFRMPFTDNARTI